MGFYAIDRKSIIEEEKPRKENMTLKEFERILKEENIPREWVSLNENYEAPVTLSGDTLHYGKYGCTRFLTDIHYDHILEKLREYKEKQDFIKSDRIAKITDIVIDASEYIWEYGDKFVVRRDSVKGENDTDLLKQRFEYIGYDQYMGYHIYEKKCGDEIFTGVEIGLEIKTQDFEREQYGFKDIAMCSCVTFPLPKKLKNQIIRYIKENKTKVISNESYLFREIINEYGFKNIIEEENKRIKFFDEAYKNILGYEIERQKYLKQYSEEKLLEVYHNIKLWGIFTHNMTLSSRPYCIEEFRINEAKRILNELIEIQSKENEKNIISTKEQLSVKDQASAEGQLSMKEQIPAKPKMSKRAKDYPRLYKIHMELLRQNEMIFKAERECKAMEDKIGNLKGIMRLTRKNKLYNQIDLKYDSIDNMKKELSGIVKRYGFNSVPYFYKTYNKVRSDYLYYQEQVAKWEEAYGEKEKS